MCQYCYDADKIRETAKKFWVNGDERQKEDDVRECIRRAYKDLTVRTMTKRKDSEVEDLAGTDEELYHAVNQWMKGQADSDFDEWHQKTCEKVISHLKKRYEEKDCTVGKAQKIVNMTFKNLYALYVTNEKAVNSFEHCHLPLDSFTLEWFCRVHEGAKDFADKKTFVKGRVAAWSAIEVYGRKADGIEKTYTSDKKAETFYTYFYMQEKIRAYFKDRGITSLQAEFVIWPNIQFEMAAEGFYAQLLKDLDKVEQKGKNAEFKKLSIADKTQRIKEHLLDQ